MTSREEASRIEQRTLLLSLGGVAGIAAGSLLYGLWIESDVVILNGVFSLISLIGSTLYLVAARLVARRADQRFPYGYAHVEPLVNVANAMMILVICLYALLNGIEGIRAGGEVVDAGDVVWFGAVTGVVCAVIGTYELRVARRTGSQLLRNDGREWLIDAVFSGVTLLGFGVLFLLDEPQRGVWARYADSVLVALLALLFVPIPIGVLRQNLREILHMRSEDDAIVARIEAAMRGIRAEHDVVSHTTHVAKVGRSHWIEINLVVGPRFAAQTIPAQDALRSRIWSAVDQPIDTAWLTILFTADPRWA